MDAIFGKQNFINEIVWCLAGTPAGRLPARIVKVHDWYLLASR